MKTASSFPNTMKQYIFLVLCMLPTLSVQAQPTSVQANSLKCVPAGSTLRIEFNRLDCKSYWLLISDDGIGLPINLNPNQSRTLGMSLIRGLSKQLGGTLEISQVNGVQISLRFSEEKAGKP